MINTYWTSFLCDLFPLIAYHTYIVTLQDVRSNSASGVRDAWELRSALGSVVGSHARLSSHPARHNRQLDLPEIAEC